MPNGSRTDTPRPNLVGARDRTEFSGRSPVSWANCLLKSANHGAYCVACGLYNRPYGSRSVLCDQVLASRTKGDPFQGLHSLRKNLAFLETGISTGLALATVRLSVYFSIVLARDTATLTVGLWRGSVYIFECLAYTAKFYPQPHT